MLLMLGYGRMARQLLRNLGKSETSRKFVKLEEKRINLRYFFPAAVAMSSSVSTGRLSARAIFGTRALPGDSHEGFSL